MLIIDGDYPMAGGRDPVPERPDSPYRAGRARRVPTSRVCPGGRTAASWLRSPRCGRREWRWLSSKCWAASFATCTPMATSGPTSSPTRPRGAQLALLPNPRGPRRLQDARDERRLRRAHERLVGDRQSRRPASRHGPRHGGRRPHRVAGAGARVVRQRPQGRQPLPLRCQPILARHGHRHRGRTAGRGPRPAQAHGLPGHDPGRFPHVRRIDQAGAGQLLRPGPLLPPELPRDNAGGAADPGRAAPEDHR